MAGRRSFRPATAGNGGVDAWHECVSRVRPPVTNGGVSRLAR
jgi:hypothetical protein